MGRRAIGTAIIGAGYWGPNLVRNVQATPDLRLEYVCDLREERAREVLGAYSTVRASSSMEEVLADPAVEAVAVATPADTHVEVVTAALEAGKHVLVEKPLAPSLAEGRRLVELADERGLVLMLDHTYCYTAAVAHLRNLVRSGVLGDVQYLDSVRINLGLVQRDVDVLWDLAPHDLSIFLSILPEGVVPVAVSANGSDPVGAGRLCVGHLTIRLSSGALAHVHVNWLSPTKVRTMIVGGSARTAVWDDLDPIRRLSVYDRGVDRVPQARLPEDARAATIVSYRTGDMVAPALPDTEALRSVMAEFVTSIVTSRPPLTDGRSGLDVLALLEAASASLEADGRFVPVAISPDAPRSTAARQAGERVGQAS
ncbi:Gfo/Idh/MocA family protein [Actinomycetospora aeridis]|uniref:Gfo/Idh/MocA family oxidoreductase n=1 Tax=Actinomycetospora aeridis TaxID=3129231 RepID=A0ABU8N6I0_9PSEU